MAAEVSADDGMALADQAQEITTLIAEETERYSRRLGEKRNQAGKRRHYRRVAVQKKRLLMAGVSKREILNFLAQCRAA